MKAFIILTIAATAVSAGLIARPVLVHTGVSSRYQDQDNLGHYTFGYAEDHATGGTFRQESSNGHGKVAGSYGLHDADGRVRIVTYIADENGFRADIKTNEPGVQPQDSAGVTVNKAGLLLPAPILRLKPAPSHYVPVYASAPIYSSPPVHDYDRSAYHRGQLPTTKNARSVAHEYIY